MRATPGTPFVKLGPQTVQTITLSLIKPHVNVFIQNTFRKPTRSVFVVGYTSTPAAFISNQFLQRAFAVHVHWTYKYTIEKYSRLLSFSLYINFTFVKG